MSRKVMVWNWALCWPGGDNIYLCLCPVAVRMELFILTNKDIVILRNGWRESSATIC